MNDNYLRELALPIAANGGREHGSGALEGDDRALQDEAGDRRHQQYEAIDGRRHAGKVVFPHPARGEGKERPPEQQVPVRPQDAAADTPGGMEHVMVVCSSRCRYR